MCWNPAGSNKQLFILLLNADGDFLESTNFSPRAFNSLNRPHNVLRMKICCVVDQVVGDATIGSEWRLPAEADGKRVVAERPRSYVFRFCAGGWGRGGVWCLGDKTEEDRERQRTVNSHPPLMQNSEIDRKRVRGRKNMSIGILKRNTYNK